MNRQALILGAGGSVLLIAAWLFAADRAVVAAAAGIAYGWMMRHVTPFHRAEAAFAASPVALDGSAERLRVLEARTSSLRHDLRGILSPALLTAERLLTHEDPVSRRAGEIMVKTVERASARLVETKG